MSSVTLFFEDGACSERCRRRVDGLAEALAEALRHSAEEFKRLQNIIERKGREAFLHDDEALRELHAQATRLAPPESRAAEAAMSVEQLKASLFADAERPVGEAGPTPSAPVPPTPPDQRSEATHLPALQDAQEHSGKLCLPALPYTLIPDHRHLIQRNKASPTSTCAQRE